MSFGGGVVNFEPVIPIGARSQAALDGLSIKRAHEWLDQAVAEYASEERDLRSNNLDPQLNRRHHLDALGQLVALKRQVAAGKMRVGSDRMARARHVTKWYYLIELRPKLQGNAKRVVRLYYAEPEVRAGTLLPLVLQTKPQGEDLGGEQDASIEEAKKRSRVWTLWNRE